MELFTSNCCRPRRGYESALFLPPLLPAFTTADFSALRFCLFCLFLTFPPAIKYLHTDRWVYIYLRPPDLSTDHGGTVVVIVFVYNLKYDAHE